MSKLFKELWAELDSQASAKTDLVQMIRAASENSKQGAWTCYLVTVWTHKAYTHLLFQIAQKVGGELKSQVPVH